MSWDQRILGSGFPVDLIELVMRSATVIEEGHESHTPIGAENAQFEEFAGGGEHVGISEGHGADWVQTACQLKLLHERHIRESTYGDESRTADKNALVPQNAPGNDPTQPAPESGATHDPVRIAELLPHPAPDNLWILEAAQNGLIKPGFDPGVGVAEKEDIGVGLQAAQPHLSTAGWFGSIDGAPEGSGNFCGGIITHAIDDQNFTHQGGILKTLDSL